MNLSKNNTSEKKWLDRKEYPFKSNFIELGMGKMHYVDEGEGDPVVMVHGNPGWSFEFRNIIKEISKTNRCIAPDHIGFGLSDKPYDWDYLPQHHAYNLETLLNSLDLENITLVVNDWGGPIGLSYAIKHPERIKKLIIMNSWMWSVKNEEHYQQFSGFMGGTIGKFLTKNFNFFGKVVLKGVLGDEKLLPKHIHRHFYKHMETRNDRKGCYTFPKQIIASSEWLNSLWLEKGKIDKKATTILWGMKDRAFREIEMIHWINNWNNPKVVKLEKIGHFPQEEDPEALINEIKSGI